MLRNKWLPFFQTTDDPNAAAQSFIAPNGFTLTPATRHGFDNFYGPGTVFQGQLQLQLAKPITGPCRLRVVFGCHQTVTESLLTLTPPMTAQDNLEASRSSSSSASSHSGEQRQLFEIENVLVKDESLAVKRHTFMFTIKFPMCNFPPSFQEGDRSVVYSIHSDLTFQTVAGEVSTESRVCSAGAQLKYLPLVPTSIPKFPVIEMAQVVDPYTNNVLFKASLESEQRGVCPGESLPLSLTLTNLSLTDLHTIHLTLIRVLTFAPLANPHPPPETTTLHTIAIPVTTNPNKGLTWNQSISYKLPSDLGILPTTNKVITPLLKVDYLLSVALPVASRSTGIASWFTYSSKSPPPVDISLIKSLSSSPPHTSHMPSSPPSAIPSAAAQATEPEHHHTNNPIANGFRSIRRHSGDKIKANLQTDRITTASSTLKWPTLIQLPLIPIIVGTVSFNVSERQLRWPIPNYLDVVDRPCFVRDRFEEEMLQQLEGLETLMMEEDDVDIDRLVQAAKKSASSGESDEEDQRVHSRIPARFRSGSMGRRKGASGLGTPPPSPPSMHTLPRAGRRSMSPKASGLGKGLLMEMHQSKVQHSMQSGLAEI